VFADAQAYDRFMGRYSVQLAPQLADLAGVGAKQRVLDVGAGTGVLTRELVRRVGPDRVAAAEPSSAFVAALRERFPGTNVVQASAETLPFPDASFDATLAQLVVHFMSDPVAGLAEMRRVTRPAGVVAACVWDEPIADASSPLSMFWRAARTVDPNVSVSDDRPGTHEGQLVTLMEQAGLTSVTGTSLWVRLRHDTFEDWWEPYENGTGPAGRYVQTLDHDQRASLKAAARSLVTEIPFETSGRAWAARAVVPG
jgi:SAM-dependent methyltransferase